MNSVIIPNIDGVKVVEISGPRDRMVIRRRILSLDHPVYPPPGRRRFAVCVERQEVGDFPAGMKELEKLILSSKGTRASKARHLRTLYRMSGRALSGKELPDPLYMTKIERELLKNIRIALICSECD